MNKPLAWDPQPKQHALIACPVPDVFSGGGRGGGKTDGLLGDFMAHAEDYGPYARGILFRRSYPELEEVERRCHELFPYVGARWQATKRTWVWPNGAIFLLRHLDRDSHANEYQGHSYTAMYFDELTNWPSLVPIDKLRACLRSPHGVPCYLRATGNPGGVGHNLVKARYVDPAPPGEPFTVTETVAGETVTIQRCYIPSTLDDNFMLLRNDPHYWERVVLAAGGREDLIYAWRHGRWDITAGGYFDDLWRTAIHTISPFEIPPGFFIRRAFDWGSAAPFAVLWIAHSDGESPVGPQKRVYPKNTRFVIGEYYGWSGRPNEGLRLTNSEIAKQIRERETSAVWGNRVKPGPADSQIFDVTNGTSIADEMALHGVMWTPAQKGPGSRRQGWQTIRGKLSASLVWPMEEPGLFVVDTCRQFVRTFPTLPRDQADPDDVDTAAEDHIGDCLRYECSMPFNWQSHRIPLTGF